MEIINAIQEVFGESGIRICGSNDGFLFVAMDVGETLGFKKVGNWIDDFDETEKVYRALEYTKGYNIPLLTEKGFRKLLKISRTVQAEKIKDYLGGRPLPVPVIDNSPVEEVGLAEVEDLVEDLVEDIIESISQGSEFISNIVLAFPMETFEIQKKVLSYKVNYMPEYNLSIERSFGKSPISDDQKRQKDIQNELRCNFLIIPEGENIFCSIGRINTYIKKMHLDIESERKRCSQIMEKIKELQVLIE